MAAVVVPTVAALWDQFARRVLPARCSEVQRTEMRRAFYAGCFSLLTEMRGTLGRPDVPEDDGAAAMEGWFLECEAVCRSIIAADRKAENRTM